MELGGLTRAFCPLVERAPAPLRTNAVAEFGEVTESKAFYDRSSFSFFEFTHDGKSTFSEESTAVVAHKIGHGLLDAIRDLWDTPFLEASAFRESFVTASLCLLRSPTPKVSGVPSAD